MYIVEVFVFVNQLLQGISFDTPISYGMES